MIVICTVAMIIAGTNTEIETTARLKGHVIQSGPDFYVANFTRAAKRFQAEGAILGVYDRYIISKEKCEVIQEGV